MDKTIVKEIRMVNNNNGMKYIFFDNKRVHCDDGFGFGDLSDILSLLITEYALSDDCEIYFAYNSDHIFNDYCESLDEIENWEDAEWF